MEEPLVEGTYKLYSSSVLSDPDIAALRKVNIVITNLSDFRLCDVLVIPKGPMKRRLADHVPVEEAMESKAGVLTLFRDVKLCRNCGTCSGLIPTYIRKHQGNLLISKHRYNTSDEVQTTVTSIIDACPNYAISLRADFVYLSPEDRDILHSNEA